MAKNPQPEVNQALSLLNGGQEAAAKSILTALVARRPTDPHANKLLALIVGAHGDDATASLYLRRAVIGDPKDPELRYLLGNTLFNQHDFKQAAGAYRECLRLVPNNIDACDGLGKCLISLDQHGDAIRAFRRGIEGAPNNSRPYSNLAQVQMTLGDMAGAAATANEGLAHIGDDLGLLEIAAFALNFTDGVAPEAHKQLHVRAGDLYAARARRPAARFANARTSGRPLRVGFLSGDFGHHVCAAFMKPALLNFDPARVLAYCYSTQPDDGGEGPFKEKCAWREAFNLDDDALAALINRDEIDILIECSGLTPGKRFGVLVPRAAPVQCTWLGYPNTTGLPTMDWRIVDAQTDPVGSEWHCREKIARLPGCFLCYTPNPWAGEVTLTPATQRADSTEPITFGSFNRITKMSDSTIATWCRVLKAVPNSRLLIKLQTMSAQLRTAALARFTGHGIAPERVEIAPWEFDASVHARMYSRIDIALDTFPYNGTTTTCEALWMGVPVVTVAGDSHRSRVGVSILNAVGMPELVAADADQYVQIAANLAADRGRLGAIRMGLRERMSASPLRDERGYAKGFAAMLHELWEQFVRG